ncbi:MAG: hypothetical protein ACRC8Y_20410 [Chroococcales cyanobacterium]
MSLVLCHWSWGYGENVQRHDFSRSLQFVVTTSVVLLLVRSNDFSRSSLSS